MLVVIMMLSGCGGVADAVDKTTQAIKEETEAVMQEETKTEEAIITLTVGSEITLGTYEQDADTANGTEAIEWYVVDVQENRALLLSKYCLDAQFYNDGDTAITWEQCTLRAWLNGDFCNEAFTEEEKAAILVSDLKNPANPDYQIDGGANTSDKVFCLSLEEANQYFQDGHPMLMGYPTEYTTQKGCYVSDSGNCWWWLRSPGNADNTAAAIAYDGSINEYGLKTRHETSNTVRPAVWVDITALG